MRRSCHRIDKIVLLELLPGKQKAYSENSAAPPAASIPMPALAPVDSIPWGSEPVKDGLLEVGHTVAESMADAASNDVIALSAEVDSRMKCGLAIQGSPTPGSCAAS